MIPTSLKIRTVLHQVHAASVMISTTWTHLCITLLVQYIFCMLVSSGEQVLFTLAVMIKSFTLAVMVKSFTLAVMMGFVCLTPGSTPDTCFGDVLHLVRLPGNLRTRAVVMILTLLDFLCFLSSVCVVLALW